MQEVMYFIPGDKGRFINRRNSKIILGDNIKQEGYYIGNIREQARCYIFYGELYIPSRDDIPSYVDFDPNLYRAWIVQDSIHYFLVKHKKSGAHFAICRYFIDNSRYNGCYFSDLLSFIDGEWERMKGKWPFEADRRTSDQILKLWDKYGNYYEEDFEIICELKGLCMPQSA